jgi:DNA mismatch repair ATPase MutL
LLFCEELVQNAEQAGATKITIDVYDDTKIVIEDDGAGMDRACE